MLKPYESEYVESLKRDVDRLKRELAESEEARSVARHAAVEASSIAEQALRRLELVQPVLDAADAYLYLATAESFTYEQFDVVTDRLESAIKKWRPTRPS